MNKTKKILISGVAEGSIAWELGIAAGDFLLSINGNYPPDVLEFWYQEKNEFVVLVIEKKNGELLEFEIEKEIYEPLGLEFEDTLFDGLRQCQQNCLFCFVKQMPKGMRRTLYYRDDDYRLSFLNGNFITGSNLTKEDLKRIASNHFSPLYFSLQCVSEDIRRFLLGDKKPERVKEQFDFFQKENIELHVQIVLCPRINDGDELKKTLEFSLSYPNVVSVGLVPVGVTKFLPAKSRKYIRPFTPKEMEEVFQLVENYRECPVYLSDEFFLKSGREIPPASYYGNFPQLENGIGMARLFLDDYEKIQGKLKKRGDKYLIITGQLWGDYLKNILPSELFDILMVENNFFGETVTVAGLLVGKDVMKALEKVDFKKYKYVLLPATSLNEEGKFLDDLSFVQLKKIVYNLKSINYLSELK